MAGQIPRNPSIAGHIPRIPSIPKSCDLLLLTALESFERLIFFHDQGAFTLLFFGSLLLHIFLGLTIGIISEFWVAEPPPIRARIGVSYSKMPSKPTLINKPKPVIEKPVLQKLETGLRPKLHKIVPDKPVLKKPVLDNNLRGQSRRLEPILDKIKFIEGDVTDYQVVSEALEGMNTIFHLAFINGTDNFYNFPENFLIFPGI